MFKFNTIKLLTILSFFLFPILAYSIESEYTVEVMTEEGQPISAVRIDGTNGIDDLNGRITGTSGLWSFDIRDLDHNFRGESPELFFTRVGYKFDPPYIKANIENCPEYTCQIKAIPSENESALIKIIFNMSNVENSGFKVKVTDAANKEIMNTYPTGFALFSVTKRTDACNDFDDNSENDFNKILVNREENTGYECSFTNLPRNVCPNQIYTNILVNGTCTYNNEVAPDNKFIIIAKDERGHAIDRLGMQIFPNDPTKPVVHVQTERDGRVLLDVNNTGYDFKVIPYGFFNFIPEAFEANVNNCFNRICRIYGYSTLKATDVAIINVSDSNENPVSGVSFKVENNYSSIYKEQLTTDKYGKAFFPIKRQVNCNNDTYNTKITPQSSNCVFSHVSETPFSQCNTYYPDLIEITADCSQNVDNYEVKGRVYSSSGLAYARVPIIVNDQMLATTRADGSYNLNIAKDSIVTIKPNIENVIFDPNFIQISKINDNQKLDFRVVAGNGFIPEDPNYRDCEPKDIYTISGSVFDLNGSPIENVNIFNNHIQITTTNYEGKFSIQVDAQSDNWITAELGEEEFDPAGISFPYISCDETEVNFQLTNYTNHLLSGRATLADGTPISELKLELKLGDDTQEIITDSDGYFRKSTKEGTLYSVNVNDIRYICTPNKYNGTASSSYTNLNFVCEFDECINDQNKSNAGICGCGIAETDTDADSVPDCIDECPSDPNKVEAGTCGCGEVETDSDNDSYPNCIDQCPEDPNKDLAGICGCGAIENLEDSDLDSYPNCIDLCPNDPNKINPGNCGCGDSDVDTDGDAISDCQDLCPEDKGKIAEGICGCGVADVDSDDDGTLDCIDECPNDLRKISPGICGCNIRDIDTDLDGTLDCEDSCPEDINKLLPGECGCGVEDIDSDGDGTLDCFDECPFDSNKILEGVCGCGISDIDSDDDGISNCKDACPSDSRKAGFGQCGCGNLETDTDNDEFADCIDLCPIDPLKIEAGICGCGTADTDTDGDKTHDCNDLCINDPLKIEPLECGCGVADIDTDNDGVLDCNESCPEDPLKTEIGICGCGVADTDLDNDNTIDCKDGCPLDSNKIQEGICGCGIADTDSDNDGTADCIDLCPLDNSKIEFGQCGCGVSDADTDNDGTADCIDECPSDVRKIEIGICGCGRSETDEDGDGTLDCFDLCPTDPTKIKPGVCGCNAKDSDGDGILDCQDKCPSDPNLIEPGVCGCNPKDSDGDGTYDCQDQCPDDPNKSIIGSCGCGVSDVDTDGDGTLDCFDECDNNPQKTSPGICGCDLLDQDSDGDQKLDCQDACPFDPSKISPGVCGCGISDIDSDGDSLSDCQDLCPTDPLKNSAGACGCGNLDLDSDGDRIPDCVDECPNDPKKQLTGSCGCGITDTDTDSDGVADCIDQCFIDPSKTTPGICGCNESDRDSDGDGTSDCIDECPNDSNKTEFGVCGCGHTDADRNNNDLIDCRELELELTPLCIDNNPTEPEELEEADLCNNGATEIIKYVPGRGSYDNEAPELDRQYANKALGVPEYNDTMNFVSLGRGGYIELGFNGKVIKDKEGPDFKIIETSWGQRGKPCDSYPEFAEVYVTKDRIDWQRTQFLCRDGTIDFNSGGTGLSEITAIRIQDVTIIEKSDGFDVDGITCINFPPNEDPTPLPSDTPLPKPTDSPMPDPSDTPDNDDEWECDNGLGVSSKCDDDRSDDDEDNCKNGKGNCNEKVTICHIPPGNPSKKKTLSISRNAYEAHIGHGDYLGECIKESSFNTNDFNTQETATVKWLVKNPNPVSHELAFKHVSGNPETDIYFKIEGNSEFTFSTPITPSLNSDGHTIKMFVDELEQVVVTHPLRSCDWTPPVTHTINVEVVDSIGNPVNRRVIIGNPENSIPDIHTEKQSGGDGIASFENMKDQLKYTVYIDKGCEYDLTPINFSNTLTQDITHKFVINKVRDLTPNSICGTVLYKGLPLEEVKVSPNSLSQKLTNSNGNFWYENLETNFSFTYSSEKNGYLFANEPNTIIVDTNKFVRYNATRDNSINNPEDFVWAGGEVKDRRGRKVKPGSKFYKRLIATYPSLNYRTKGFFKTINIDEPFSWIEQVEKGKRYTFKILKDGGYRVASKPAKYRKKFRRSILGLHFALTTRNTRFFKNRMKRSRKLREMRNK